MYIEKSPLNASLNLFALSLVTGPNETSNGSLGIKAMITSVWSTLFKYFFVFSIIVLYFYNIIKRLL